MAPRGEGIVPGSLNLFLALLRQSWRWLVLLGPWSVDQRQGVTVPNLCSRAAGPLTGAPNPRAPRLGPRAFSISVVNSFGGNFVWLYIFIHATISSLTVPLLLLSGANHRAHRFRLRQQSDASFDFSGSSVYCF